MEKFIGRRKEKEEIVQSLRTLKKAILVYGKRRVGKSTLVRKAVEECGRPALYFQASPAPYPIIMDAFSAEVSSYFGVDRVSFSTLRSAFSFMTKATGNLVVVIDEYQWLKSGNAEGSTDSEMQLLIDTLPEGFTVILSGSDVSMLKEICAYENPLFGRFSTVIHLTELSYLEASLFCPGLPTRDKVAFYSVFGGSPYILQEIDWDRNLEWNIQKLFLRKDSFARTYVEFVLLGELRKIPFSNTIISSLANRRLRFSELSDLIVSRGGNAEGLEKYLPLLTEMEIVKKTFPINRKTDRRKVFYELSDNLLRFYFAYSLSSVAFFPEDFFQTRIQPSLGTFISYRFEDVARQYFIAEAESGKRKGIRDVGTYFFNDKKKKRNGELGCVLDTDDGYVFCEVKFHASPLDEGTCLREIEEVDAISEIHASSYAFISLSGFSFESEKWELISGDELYRNASEYS